MRFLVDAQLPARLARHLTDAGHDAVHSLDLPAGNRTTARPSRLLIVATGNIDNGKLVHLFDQHLADIVGALTEVRFVELASDRLIVHEDR